MYVVCDAQYAYCTRISIITRAVSRTIRVFFLLQKKYLAATNNVSSKKKKKKKKKIIFTQYLRWLSSMISANNKTGNKFYARLKPDSQAKK